MNFKKLAVASAFAVVSAGSFAAPGDVIATGSFQYDFSGGPGSFSNIVAGFAVLGAYDWEVAVATTGLSTFTDVKVNGLSNAASGKVFSGTGTGADSFGLEIFATTTGAKGNFGGSYTITQAIPEPETYALMLAGLGAIGYMARRRKA